MQQLTISQHEIALVGIQIRTNNQLEMNPATAQIAALGKRYFSQDIASQIKHRKNPGVTFCAYSDYASDHQGDYCYLLGEEVTHISQIPPGCKRLLIPAGKYVKLTSETGPMPKVLIELWQKIWQMTPETLGGKRLYNVDYEVHQPNAADIYLGVQ